MQEAWERQPAKTIQKPSGGSIIDHFDLWVGRSFVFALRLGAQISLSAIVLVLSSCASGDDSIKLASGEHVKVVRVGYEAYQRFGGYPIQHNLTIRYETKLPLESDRLKSEVTDVWRYFTPAIRSRHWDTVKIEPMTFGFMMLSWRGLPFIYRRTDTGWTDPWQPPPAGPEIGIGTIPQ